MKLNYPEKLQEMCREILKVSQKESASTRGARLTLAALYGSGVKNLVLSPGSRNAPLVYAADMLEQVSKKLAQPFTTTVRLDERSAAFFALGLSRGSAQSLLSPIAASVPVLESSQHLSQTASWEYGTGSIRQPVAIAVTSGTAVANLHPAVLEAAHQQLPLIILSADRPAHLRGTGANQTTLQAGIFAEGVKACLDIEVSAVNPEELFGLILGAVAYAENRLETIAAIDAKGTSAAIKTGERSERTENTATNDKSAGANQPQQNELDKTVLGQGYRIIYPEESIAKGPGPVQINLCFEPALNPQSLPQNENPQRAEKILQLAAEHLNETGTYFPPAISEPKPETGDFSPEEFKTALKALEKAVFIAGDQAYLPAAQLAQQAQIPIFAEGSANLGPEVKAYAGAGIIVGELAPELVIFTGHPTLTRAVTALLSREDLPIYQVDPGAPAVKLSARCKRLSWQNYQELLRTYLSQPERHAQSEPAGDVALLSLPGTAAEKLEKQGKELTEPGTAASEIAKISQIKAACLQQAIAQELSANPQLDTFKVTEILCQELAQSTREETVNLLVGASNSIRALDILRPFKTGINILANRGLAGIDGTISTAGGLALSTGKPWYLLIGDLTFLHDLNGLLYGAYEQIPDMHIILCNDQGGQIFSTLEYGREEYAGVFPRFFQTPQTANFAHLVQGMGHRYEQVTTAEELRASLSSPVAGIKVTEIQADPGDFCARLQRITQSYQEKQGKTRP